MDVHRIRLHGPAFENGATDVCENLPVPRLREVTPRILRRPVRALGFVVRREADGIRDR